MLYLDIKLEQTKEMFCSEALLATVAVWLNRRYEMIFSQAWTFKLIAENSNNPGAITERIYIEKDKSLQLLEQYHGIKLNYNELSNPEDIIDIAHQQLNNGLPLAVYFNTKYYPWNQENSLKGIYYPCLIIGISDDNKGIYCIDIHEHKKPALIPIDIFLKAYKNCITFSIINSEVENVDWKQVINNNIDYLIKNNAFHSMRELSKLIGNPINCIKEINNSDILGEKIKYIYHLRYFFSNLITYLIQYHNAHELSNYKDRFSYIANQWVSFWGLITSTMYLQKLNPSTESNFQKNFTYKLEAAATKLRYIADIEENLCNDLVNVIEGKSLSPTSVLNCTNTIAPTDKLKEYQFIDISDFLNNEGFYSEINLHTAASLTYTGQVFLTHGFPSDPIWNTHGMKFNFPCPIDGENDNISCSGQKICLVNDYYPCIMFLGCAEWGHYSELMEIHYLDGTISRIPLEFTDWSYPDSHFEEFVVWEGMCGEKDINGILRDSILKGHLYARAIKLDSSLKLDYIQLPDCLNIHIFAITLAK